MSLPDGQLSALVSLIADATKIVEAHYKTSSKPYAPSLDDTEEHPLDTKLTDPELRDAIQTVEGACAQLCATVARPNHTVVNHFMDVFLPSCLSVAISFKIADILLGKPKGMHITEISQKSGVEPGKLGRILRLLATKHIFREVTQNVFANNRLSMQLLSTNPISNIGLHLTQECGRSSTYLFDVLGDAEWGHSYAPEHTPFNKSSGFPGPLFMYYEGATPLGAYLGTRFGIGMLGWGNATEASAVIREYPWKDLSPGSSVCDVGGGIGDITLQLAKAYPHLQLKLQDLPERILQAKNEVWPAKCPEAIAEDRIQFEPIDFLSESPIPGCDIYYLKNIIHDWPDADCNKILTGIRKVMTPNSRVLVHEYILKSASRVESSDKISYTQAPEPLLPNYGAGRLRQYNLDINMMTMLNSKERHLDEFMLMGEKAGLKFVKLWDFGEMGAVEYRL